MIFPSVRGSKKSCGIGVSLRACKRQPLQPAVVVGVCEFSWFTFCRVEGRGGFPARPFVCVGGGVAVVYYNGW